MSVIFVSLGSSLTPALQVKQELLRHLKELHGMGDGAYTKRLRVAGNVQPGHIKRTGSQCNSV